MTDFACAWATSGSPMRPTWNGTLSTFWPSAIAARFTATIDRSVRTRNESGHRVVAKWELSTDGQVAMAKKKIIPSNQQMKPPETVELWNSYAFQWNPRFSVLELGKTPPNIRKSVHIPMSSWEAIKSASCRSSRQHDLCYLPPELSEQLENSRAIGDHQAWADATKRQTL